MSTDSEIVQTQRGTPPDPELPSDTERPVGDPAAIGKGLLRPRTLISFAVALAILVFFFQRLDLDLAAVAQNIRSADLLLLSGAILAYIATIVLRAMRWRWMLVVAGAGTLPGTTVPPVGYITAVLLVSWFFNCILPAKLGDAYRIYRIKVDDGIRYSVGFGTVLTERLIDLMVLVVMLTISALFAFHGNLPSDATSTLYVGVALSVLALVGLVFIWFFRDQIEERLPLRFRNQWSTLQTTVFVNLRQPLVPAVVSVIIWSLEASRVFLVAKALNVHISFELAIFVGLMAALLTTLPFTPAGLGVVEVATVSVLKLVDVPVDLAGSVSLLDRLITYWGLIAVGALVYLYLLKWGSRKRIESDSA